MNGDLFQSQRRDTTVEFVAGRGRGGGGVVEINVFECGGRRIG